MICLAREEEKETRTVLTVTVQNYKLEKNSTPEHVQSIRHFFISALFTPLRTACAPRVHAPVLTMTSVPSTGPPGSVRRERRSAKVTPRSMPYAPVSSDDIQTSATPSATASSTRAIGSRLAAERRQEHNRRESTAAAPARGTQGDARGSLNTRSVRAKANVDEAAIL